MDDDFSFDDDLPPDSAEPWSGDEVARFLKGDRWASFIDGFRVTEYDLGILAKHYLDIGYGVAMFEHAIDTPIWRWGNTRFAAAARLDDIEQAFGAKKFAAAIGKATAKWRQRVANFDKEEGTLACPKCGGKRSEFELMASGVGRNDPCRTCRHKAVTRPASCTKCGRQREGKRHDITGDLCEQCYVESLLPCANCGGKRDMRHRDALCYECHTAPIAPCEDCGATRYRGQIDGEFDHGYCDQCTL